jgi:predicted RNA-binding protein
MRDHDHELPGGLDHVRALRHGDVLAVDVDGDEVGFGSGKHQKNTFGPRITRIDANEGKIFLDSCALA